MRGPHLIAIKMLSHHLGFHMMGNILWASLMISLLMYGILKEGVKTLHLVSIKFQSVTKLIVSGSGDKDFYGCYV